MAGNHLTLHTNDRVVVTTSRGNQEKWFDAEENLWYKVDDGCFEALAEAVSSEVLRNFTNAARLPGISVANYWVDTAEVHGLKRVASVRSSTNICAITPNSSALMGQQKKLFEK